MPAKATFPGVYIEEIPGGVRTINGVATSITAFIGRAAKGPVDEPITINNYSDFERRFGGLYLKSPVSFTVRDFFLNGGSQAIIVRLHENASSAVITLDDGTCSSTHELILEAASTGEWGVKLNAHVDHDTKSPTNDKLFNLTVFEKEPNSGQILTFEKFLNVTVDSTDVRYIKKVLEECSDLVRVQVKGEVDQVSSIRPKTTWKIKEPVSNPPEYEENPTPATGGSDGNHLDDDSFIGAEKEGNKQGLYSLEKADLFNLLCIPPYCSADGSVPTGNATPTDITSELISKADAYCRKRHAMLLLDSHSTWKSTRDAKKEFPTIYPGTTSNYAALFFPRLKQRNPLRENQMEEFVSCGAVAGIFARTDTQQGVWKAPAGQEASLNGAPQLSVSLTDAENSELNQLGLNCLRAFPVYGKLVWGSRTLGGDDRLSSEWKYIPVRRTALFIEESLIRGTKWVVFEPNNESLWAQIRLNIGAFMHNLFQQGAFQGTTPRDAYLVKCDSETTTQNDINQGIVNILVGFAPLKPAEFVLIKIQHIAGQIET